MSMQDGDYVGCVAELLVLFGQKFGRIAAKPLKSMILDFYGVDELCEAKRQLMSDVISLNLDIALPHIRERRDGDSKAVRNALLMTYLQ